MGKLVCANWAVDSAEMVVAGGQRARDAVEEWLRFHGCHDTLAAIHREIAAYEEVPHCCPHCVAAQLSFAPRST